MTNTAPTPTAADPAIRARRFVRTPVQLEITASSVLESFSGVIADLSEGGALVLGGGLPARARCQLQYQGQTVYGTVMWSEIDRMGVRFPFELSDGPLAEALEAARGAPANRGLAGSTWLNAPRTFGRRGLTTQD